MKKRPKVCREFAVIELLSLNALTCALAEKPNIILMIADDMGDIKNLATDHPERAQSMRSAKPDKKTAFAPNALHQPNYTTSQNYCAHGRADFGPVPSGCANLNSPAALAEQLCTPAHACSAALRGDAN